MLQNQNKKFYKLYDDTKSQIAKAILRKTNGVGITRFPDFRPDYKAAVIKTAWHWHKHRNVNQWTRIESPEVTPHTYGQLIYDKRGKNIQWRKEVFSISGVGNWTTTCTRMKLEYFLTPYTKINSKWIKDLNVRLDTKTQRKTLVEHSWEQIAARSFLVYLLE